MVRIDGYDGAYITISSDGFLFAQDNQGRNATAFMPWDTMIESARTIRMRWDYLPIVYLDPSNSYKIIVYSDSDAVLVMTGGVSVVFGTPLDFVRALHDMVVSGRRESDV